MVVRKKHIKKYFIFKYIRIRSIFPKMLLLIGLSRDKNIVVGRKTQSKNTFYISKSLILLFFEKVFFSKMLLLIGLNRA